MCIFLMTAVCKMNNNYWERMWYTIIMLSKINHMIDHMMPCLNLSHVCDMFVHIM